MATWESVLAEMEAEGEALDASLRGDGPMPESTPWISPDLPPIPMALRGRVKSVIRRQAGLQSRLENEIAHAAPALRQRPNPFEFEPTPSFLDVRA